MGNSSRPRGTVDVLLGSAGLLLFLFVFLVGPVPIADGLYHAGLWPRQTPSELATAFNEKSPFGGVGQFRCEDGTQGWDYVCFAVRSNGPNFKFVVPPGPVKFGAIGNSSSTLPTLLELPIDQPTPAMDEFMRAYAERAKTEQGGTR